MKKLNKDLGEDAEEEEGVATIQSRSRKMGHTRGLAAPTMSQLPNNTASKLSVGFKSTIDIKSAIPAVK